MPFVCEKGARVGGRYELARMLGEGGMGEVWAAIHLVTRKPVALKFLKQGHARPEERRRFLREARAASAVHHENVVAIHDILELEDGTPVLVMDLLAGYTLAHRLARFGKLPLDETCAILAPVVSAVGTAHSVGIVHRDLKPDNIFLVEHIDNRLDIRVLDFGVAKLTATEGDAAQTAGLTRTGEILGTPYYMSPEQVFGEHDVDHRADVWSLGVILYECLAGKRPFEGDNVGQVLKKVMMGGLVPLAEVAPTVPPQFCSLVGRMLSVDRALRPELRELLELFRLHTNVTALSFGSAIDPLSFQTQPERPLPRVADPFGDTTASDAAVRPRRRRAWAWALAGFLAADALAIGALWIHHQQKPTPVSVSPTPYDAKVKPISLSPPPPVTPPPTVNPAHEEKVKPVSLSPTPPPTQKPSHAKNQHVKKQPQAKPKDDKLPGGVVDQVPF